MDTQTIVILAIAINFAVALAAIIISWYGRQRADAPPTQKATNGSASLATGGNGNGGTGNGHDGGGTAATGNGHGTPTNAMTPGSAAAGSVAAGSAWFPARGDTTADPGTGDPGQIGVIPIDDTTGLDLGVAWARWLDEEEARNRRFHRPATVVLVELTGFERLTERLGIEVADQLIPPIATTLRKDARATDHLARLGRTRFAALLPETSEVQAINYVERIRSACDVWLEAGAVALRLSIGWAEIGSDRAADVALLDAERRLFAERERTRRQLSRQDDESAPPVEMPSLRNSGA